MTIEQAQARMAAILAAADARPEDERSLSDEEVTEYETLEADLVKAHRNIELRKRHEAYRTPVIDSTVTASQPHRTDLDRAFESYLRTGQTNADLIQLRAQGEGVPAAGGYLVPDGFRAQIVERIRTWGGILNAVQQITTDSGNPLSWPTLDDTVEGEIVAEHATGTAGADIVLGTASLGAYKYMSLGAGNVPLRVSVELLQDSAFDVSEALVSRILGQRIGKKQARDAVAGTGTGMPLGIAVGAGGTAMTATGTITYADLVRITHAIDPGYRVGASWGFNDVALAAVESVVDTTGRPLLNPQGQGISGGTSGSTLLGHPVYIDAAFANNTGDDIVWGVFGDLEATYVWRNVRDIQLVVDPYTRSANGEVTFVAWARADGTVQDPNAYTKIRTQNV